MSHNDDDNPAFDRVVADMTVNRERNAALDRAIEAMIHRADITPQELAQALGVHAHHTAYSSYDDTALLIAKAEKLIELVKQRWAGFPMSIDLRDALSRLAAEMAALALPNFDAEPSHSTISGH